MSNYTDHSNQSEFTRAFPSCLWTIAHFRAFPSFGGIDRDVAIGLWNFSPVNDGIADRAGLPFAHCISFAHQPIRIYIGIYLSQSDCSYNQLDALFTWTWLHYVNIQRTLSNPTHCEEQYTSTERVGLEITCCYGMRRCIFHYCRINKVSLY